MPVWQKAHQLSLEIFKISSTLPRSEDYGLTSQIRRSSNSVSGNIAEGFGRSTKKDKAISMLLPADHLMKPRIICNMAEKLVILMN